MTMNKELDLSNDVGKLNVSMMEGGRGLIGCKMCVKAEKNSIGWYVKHHKEHLTVAVQYTVPSENSTQPKESKQQGNEE